MWPTRARSARSRWSIIKARVPSINASISGWRDKVQRGLTMHIRVLTAEDATAWQTLRLASLRDHPEAFGSAYEDECTLTMAAVGERLQPTADGRTFGAWVDDHLAGILSFHRSRGRKTRHRAGLGAMYVAPAYQGQGIGRQLIDTAIQYGRSLPDLEE